jgi:TRAP-type C4-dicarboxylate transport system substrate-binding protein
MMFIRAKHPAIGIALCVIGAGAGCGTTPASQAGGDAPGDAVTLTVANGSGEMPVTLQVYSDHVSELTNGAVTLEFQPGDFGDDVETDRHLVEMARDGDVDIALVRPRVFDTLGVTAFQPLIAPMLTDSYKLEQAVLESAITDPMLTSLDELGLTGVTVLPGPLQRIVGRTHPMLSVDDFAGQHIANPPSDVAAATYAALGGSQEPWVPGSPLAHYDGIAMQFAAVLGRNYEVEANAMTSNLVMWPGQLAVVANVDAYEQLTDDQRTALREAATDAMDETIEAIRREEDAALQSLCDFELPIVNATDDQRAGIRDALEPVYDEIASHGDNGDAVDRIAALKEELDVPPDGPTCEPEPVGTAADSATTIPKGTYRNVQRAADAESTCPDLAADIREGNGIEELPLEMDLNDGKVTIWWTMNGERGGVMITGNYTVDGDQFTFRTADGVDTFTGQWALEGTSLVFTGTGSDCYMTITWPTYPWELVE